MLRKLHKLASKNAQHALEYVILITLIMAGIIIGGPYVIRSWNAVMKGWEDSVTDSMNDPLAEAPVGMVTIQGCDTGAWIQGTCGPTSSPVDPCTGDTVDCPVRWRIFTRTFTPAGCQCNVPSGMTPAVSAECRQDSSFDCCTNWVTPSGCTFPDGTPPPCLLPTVDCGVNAGCPDGQYRRSRSCDISEFQNPCVVHPSCAFSCQGSPIAGTGYLAPCASDTVGLSNNTTTWTYTDICSPAKCEIPCNNTSNYYAW